MPLGLISCNRQHLLVFLNFHTHHCLRTKTIETTTIGCCFDLKGILCISANMHCSGKGTLAKLQDGWAFKNLNFRDRY